MTTAWGLRLAGYLAWSPPPMTPNPAAMRELYITRSYQFSYPQDWVPGRPGFNETIAVSPKGGLRGTGERREIEIGVMAGAIELEDFAATPMQTLLAHLPSIRPGLSISDHAPDIDLSGFALDNQLLEGAVSGHDRPERVWAVATRQQDRLIYLLMIAPVDQFHEYRPEFEAIQRSLQFEGPPQNGRAEDPIFRNDNSDQSS